MNPVPLFLIIVSLPLLLGGCGGEKKESVTDVKPELEGVNLEELERRTGGTEKDIVYLKGSDTPYTGKSFELYKDGQKRSESNWKDGKRGGLEVWWHENGQKSVDLNWKDGELISQKWWNSKGEPVDSQEEAK
ncbi:hypothetical protein OAF75_00730 [Verrucomicrobiales bacterium]|nr:hypothetical protein [Verrucomicrobiales bacterium]